MSVLAHKKAEANAASKRAAESATRPPQRATSAYCGSPAACVPCKRQESEEGRWSTSSCPKAPENSHARAPCDGKSRAEPQRVLTSSSRTRSARPQRILRAQRDLCVILYRWIRHRPHQSSCLLLRHRCCLIGALKARTWSTIAPLVAQPNHLPLLLPLSLHSALYIGQERTPRTCSRNCGTVRGV